MIELELFGNINNTGCSKIEENKCIIDILNDDARGMTCDKNLEIAQLGGPLGPIAAGNDLKNSLLDYRDKIDIPTVMFLNNKFCPVDFCKFMISYAKREIGFSNQALETLGDLIEELSSGNVRKYTYEELQREVKEPFQDPITEKIKSNINYLINRYEDIFLEHFERRRCAAGICNRLFSAQCVNACPAEIDIPGYIALMYQGKDDDAYRLMRQKNPLSLICGKICARPCEARCRRGEIEQTVGVRALKHYAAASVLNNGVFTESKRPENGKAIGIIGAGPAGLSAAYYMAKTGYTVNLYEKHSVTGGMLAMGVPSYRISQTSIDKEVALIENLGVKIHRNTEVGKDISFTKLREKHDALVLATGCHIPNLFSDHLKNLESAIDFLREVKLNGRTNIGDEVVVIGGGDVAMDAARTAVRLGAEKVAVVSLERYQQMPANDEEKEEAQKEGVEFYNGFGTKLINELNERAHEIILKRCISLFDQNNKMAPQFDDNDIQTLHCDNIILAIGQKSDISYLESAVETDSRGRIIFDKQQRTSLPEVFIAGDMSGPGSAIKAIAEGRRAAEEIDAHLGGDGLYINDEINVPKFQSHYSLWDTKGSIEKVDLFSKGCKNAFEENRTVLVEDMARSEALRCMRCDRNSRQ